MLGLFFMKLMPECP